jgi:hypothetical protein
MLSLLLFLVHGEPPASEALMSRLTTSGPHNAIIIPALDSSYRLTKAGAVLVTWRAPSLRLFNQAVA